MKFLRCLTFLMCLSGATSASQAVPADNCLRLGTDESLGEHYKAFEALISAMYQKAGLCANTVAMSPKRIEQQIASGTLDGDWFRPAEYIETRNLEAQIVPQPLFGMEARLIWLEGTSFSGKPEGLENLNVGYRSGYRWLERHIPLMGGKSFPIASGSQIKALLLHGRIHVYATSSVFEPLIFRSFGKDSVRLRSAHWATVPFFHLLHLKHADKIPALNAALREIIESGEMAALLPISGITMLPLSEH